MFTPRYIKQGRILLRHAEKLVRYRKDVWNEATAAEFKTQIKNLEKALKLRDEPVAKAGTVRCNSGSPVKWGAKTYPFKITSDKTGMRIEFSNVEFQTYIEIGNEDWFDRTNSYDGRFNQFRNAIETKYPQLHCISTIADAQYPAQKITTGKKPYMLDEHYYRNSWAMWENASQYDKYDRKGPKIFVGEWATREGAPTTNLNAALGDAAWMTGMERNSDIILMSCYAPLFVNVNTATSTAPKAWQWDSDLIGYNALSSYGSPSYYVQKLFGNYLGNKIVPVIAENIPTQPRPLTRRDSTDGITKAPLVPTVFYSATRDEKTGAIYLKVVNTTGQQQPVEINIKGVANLSPGATLVVVKGNKPEDTNTITDPEKIIPVTSKINDVAQSFTRNLDPYSVSIFQLQAVK